MGGQSTAALRSIPANCIAMCIVLREREGRLEVGKRGGHRTAPLLMRRPLTGLCRQQLLDREDDLIKAGVCYSITKWNTLGHHVQSDILEKTKGVCSGIEL